MWGPIAARSIAGAQAGVAALAVSRPRFWLSRTLNPNRPDPVFERLRDTIAFRLDMLAMNAFDRNLARDRWVSALKAQPPRTGRTEAVRRAAYHPDTIKDLVHLQEPLHFPGLLGDSDFQPWDFDGFVREFADEDVLLACPVFDGYVGKVAELDVPGVYLHNSEVLVHRHPELLHRAGLAHILNTVATPLFCTGIAQIFAGRARTGSFWHCAPAMNVFLMLEGRKKWRFIDPAESPLLLPRTSGAGRSAYFHTDYGPASATFTGSAELLGDDVDDAYDAEAKALYDQTTRYEVVLEPGDVLFSPAWWWHDVENLTDSTIGMATRWALRGRKISNPTFDWGSMLNPRFYTGMYEAAFSQDVVSKGQLKPVPTHPSEDRSIALEGYTRAKAPAAYFDRAADIDAYYASHGATR